MNGQFNIDITYWKIQNFVKAPNNISILGAPLTFSPTVKPTMLLDGVRQFGVVGKEGRGVQKALFGVPSAEKKQKYLKPKKIFFFQNTIKQQSNCLLSTPLFSHIL